jgi:cystathionine gamma-synthase
MNDSSFEALAEEIEGLLGIDAGRRAGRRTDTNLVHGYGGNDPQTGAVSQPIYQTATFAHPAFGSSTGFAYSRCGNPTNLELENTIALLEGGVKAFSFASGMAAVSCVAKLFAPGDHVLVSDDLYGGTYRLFTDYYGSYGVEFEYIDTADAAVVAAALRPNTRALFVETPTNPMMHVADLAALADLAHGAGALLIVDNTFLTSYFQRPFDFGADVVVYSGTKYLCGHNDVLSGFVVLPNGDLIERLYTAAISEGATLAPFDAWLMLRSLKTLGVRLRRQESNALAVCEFLKAHPAVTDVYYVGDPDHPGYALSKAQTSGFGAMLSFRVDTHERLLAVLDRVRTVSFAESLGGVESLITYPLVQTHGAIPPEMRDRLGIDERLLRLSVGLEDAQDIIDDLAQALA